MGDTRRARDSYPEMRVAQSLDLARLLELARWLDPQISADAEHSTRVSRVALALADAAGLDGPDVALATIGGLLHDVGKVAVPMPILAKRGPLDDVEYDQVKRHPAASGALVVRADLGHLADLLRHHHERWDGRGYPDGLAGSRIPLVSRVLAIADAYDAMLADRPYRLALDALEARHELEQGAGTQFDPGLVEVFLGIRSTQLRRVA
jgi:polar amino acid transport system substrate-binding protein